MGRILGVDLGEKRVGLALTDPLKMIASPFQVLFYTSLAALAGQIKTLITEKDIETVVIGYPVREDGALGPGCAAAAELHDLLTHSGIQTVLWDERYTSKMAEYILQSSGIKVKNMKGQVDKIAASLLLESYLRSLV